MLAALADRGAAKTMNKQDEDKNRRILLTECINFTERSKMMATTIKCSAQGAIICGATTFVGGVLLGPLGMAIGGSLGAVIALKTSPGIHFLCIKQIYN